MEDSESSRDSEIRHENDDSNHGYSPSDQVADMQQSVSDVDSRPGSPISTQMRSSRSSPSQDSPPASPTSEDSRPASPASEDNSRPASPASEDDSRPASPASLDDSCPASPASQDESRPASPASQNESRPPTPASQDGSRPYTPASQDVSRPSTPASQDDSRPATPASQDDSENETTDKREKESLYESDEEDKVHESKQNESDVESDEEGSPQSPPKTSIRSLHFQSSKPTSQVHSDDEVAVSDQENFNESNTDEKDHNDGRKQDESDMEFDNDSVPELNIDSGDEDNQLSENEAGKEDDENDIVKDEENDSSPDNDDKSEGEESEIGELIADIFGDSDEEEEDFEGFGEEDLEAAKKKQKQKKETKAMLDSEDEDEMQVEKQVEKQVEEDIAPASMEVSVTEEKEVISKDDSEDEYETNHNESFISDFDLMLMKKKEQNSKRRKRKDEVFISDSDDLIAEIISQMKQAAEEDLILIKQRKIATKKLKIFSHVMSQLKKQDLQMSFIDQGVLNVMADWLAPLPDRSLPNFQIRQGLIKCLEEFPVVDQSFLKTSGIGKAVMFLFKHPRETKGNREREGRLITAWSRPIFNVVTNFHDLSQEERDRRGFETAPKKRKTCPSPDRMRKDEVAEKKDIGKALTEKEISSEKKPGEKGWIARARVPMPSRSDYKIRPESTVQFEMQRGSGKRSLNRFEKHMKNLDDKRRINRVQQAVKISVEGRNMTL